MALRTEFFKMYAASLSFLLPCMLQSTRTHTIWLARWQRAACVCSCGMEQRATHIMTFVEDFKRIAFRLQFLKMKCLESCERNAFRSHSPSSLPSKWLTFHIVLSIEFQKIYTIEVSETSTQTLCIFFRTIHHPKRYVRLFANSLTNRCASDVFWGMSLRDGKWIGQIY